MGALSTLDGTVVGVYLSPTNQLPKINIRVIGSGSSGNATLFNIEGHDDWLMFDCGVPYVARQIKDYNVSAIFVTHCHSDHCGKVKYIKDIPIYGTKEELTDERVTKSLEHCKENPKFKYIKIGNWIRVNEYLIIPISALHDTPNPCHYFVSDGSRSFFYGCDTGTLQPRLNDYFDAADVIMVESDYDEEAMKTDMIDGHEVDFMYGADLKERVMKVHSGNKYIRGRLNDYLDKVLVSHISKTYNSTDTVQKYGLKVVSRYMCPYDITL